MKYYISRENVQSSIDYFKEAPFDSDDNLFLFLFGKHIGITTSFPISYLAGGLSESEKNDRLTSIWMLGGLFDSNETCKKRGLMFPTAFGKVSLYQPGTEFLNVLGRIKDTIEKKNTHVPVYSDNNSNLTLKNNYKDLISTDYLMGNKISLSHLAAWTFRFTAFDFDEEPDEKQFTRVIQKATRKFFRITKNDFLWLFEDDLSSKRLTPAQNGIEGREIRANFDFSDDKIPEVESASQGDNTQTSVVEKPIVQEYLVANGDNPSDKDIMSILMSKKQIVLTGVPGVGKSWYTQRLCNDSTFIKTKTIQFHADYTYEDFIGAETLKTTESGTAVITKKGVFLTFAKEAEEDPEHNYLFVIDELNRGNIAEIFGESILALDRNYCVELSKDYEGVSELRLPENLYIVGTMNTSDRNIAFLDLAIRRRFAFVSLMPNYDFLSENVDFEDFDLGNILKIINHRILDTLKDPELILGQSYFIPPKDDDQYTWSRDQFKNQFNFVLLPTLKEYSFNESSAVATVIGENLGDGIQDTDDFMQAFSAEFMA